MFNMDTAYPLISVIIPVYKVERYLHECVDSVLSQNYRNLEIILINDGSPDSCGDICDQYAEADNRIKVIHKENGGLSDSRNAGLDICTGDYVAFVDSDDSVLPGFIETLYGNIKKYSADISMVGSYRTLVELDESHEPPRISFYPNYLDFLYDDTIKEWKTEVWKKLYRKEIWEKLRFPVGKKSEDTFVFPYIVYQRKIVYTDRKLYYYRINPKSIMGSFNDSVALDANEAFAQNIEFYKKFYPAYVERVRESQLNFNYSYYLRFKLYNEVCRQYLINNMGLVFRIYPIRTSVKLYFMMIFLTFLKRKKQSVSAMILADH